MKAVLATNKVFLSYAKSDQRLAYALSQKLVDLDFTVWNDQSIAPGENWLQAIGKALETCDSMIALLNENSFSSKYVRAELQHALFDEKYKNRLLPVLLGTSRNLDFGRLPWVLQKLPVLKIPMNLSTEESTKKISSKFMAQLSAAENSQHVP